MYFLDLASFHPKTGISTDKHSRYPLLESTDGLFEPSELPFNFSSSFPFEKIELIEGEPFYISEPNLIKVFKNNINGDNKILVNKLKPIDAFYTQILAAKFYQGYSLGLAKFYQEIGQSYLSLDLEQQKKALRDFIIYCHRNLYFEGFAIPAVIYALGYIQASLVRGFQEYTNLNGLNEVDQVRHAANAYPLVKAPEREVPIQRMGAARKESSGRQDSAGDYHISLRYPAAEILNLWCALLDSELCQLMRVPQSFSHEQEVKVLLGRLFNTEEKEQNWPSDNSPYYYQLAPGYQSLLCLLMHATYKLNTTYLKVPQLRYCELLQSNFSPFQTYESAGDIQRNMTKKKDSAFQAVTKCSGPYASKAIEVLKKVPHYF